MKKKSQLDRAHEAQGDERRLAARFREEHPEVFEKKDRERVFDPADGKSSVRTVPLWEDWDNRLSEHGVGDRFIPMVGESARVWTLEDEAKQQRAERALKRMPAKQRNLLLAYFIEGRKLLDLREGEESKQAVYHRVRRARARFEKEWRKQ